jgi:hypothetical protein
METRPTGHITCSSLDRIFQCPGSWNLEQQVPVNEDDSSLEAQSGVRIHAALAGEIEKTILTAEEREIYDTCISLTSEVLPGKIYGSKYSVERRLFWKLRGETILSGRFDALWEGSEKDTIIDYKTGRGDVPPANQNWQMRGLAVLRDINYNLDDDKTVEVAIIQPLGTPQVTRCLYTQDDLLTAHGEIWRLLTTAYDKDAPRRPSESACKYCRAKAICPEAQGIVTSLARVEDGEDKLSLISAEDLGELLEACFIAPKIIDAIKAEAKLRIEAGEKFGWHLKPGVERETITDVLTVYTRLSTLDGITQQEFIKVLKATKKDVKDLLRNSTGQKGYALDLTLKQRLEGCTETKTTEPSLEKDDV